MNAVDPIDVFLVLDIGMKIRVVSRHFGSFRIISRDFASFRVVFLHVYPCFWMFYPVLACSFTQVHNDPGPAKWLAVSIHHTRFFRSARENARP
jgi:hypothetical protein